MSIDMGIQVNLSKSVSGIYRNASQDEEVSAGADAAIALREDASGRKCDGRGIRIMLGFTTENITASGDRSIIETS
jgi:hypothetical protein